jgi:hypothetical protein
LRLNGDLASGSAFYFIGTADNIELTDTDAEQSWVNIQPNINQSGTASYSALKISVLETATGSGSKYLLDTGTRDGAGVHTSKLSITNAGVINFPAAGRNTILMYHNTPNGFLLDSQNEDLTLLSRTEGSIFLRAGGTLQLDGVRVGTYADLALTQTSTTFQGVKILYNYNQSGTAGATDFLISRYEQAVGSGSQLLIDAGTNSAASGGGTHTSKFSVSNAGILLLDGPIRFVNTGYSIGRNSGTGALDLVGYGGIHFQINNDRAANNAFDFVSNTNVELTDTDAQQAWMYLGPKINQSGTAGYEALKINVTETGTGSGDKNLIDAQVGSVSKAQIQNTGAFSSTLINNADSDTDEIDSVTWAGGFGMLIACSVTDSTSAVWRLKGTTFIAVSVDGDWTSTKDTAASYNVYFESGAIKLQNKVGDNKNVKLGFYGML